MPSYISSAQPQQVHAIYSGDQVALVNSAATDSGVTNTIQVAIGPDPGGNNRVTLVNTTNQTATVQVANSDANANYQPYSDEGTSITVSTDTTKGFVVGPPCWIRCNFATAPTSGSLVLMR